MRSGNEDDLQRAIAEGYARRDRNNMAPTIEYVTALLAQYPDHPEAIYEVGGAYDTAGEEERARGFYERALAAGLQGDTRRRCLLQYGSTLRNLGLFDESIVVLREACSEFPESDSLRVFLALSLHAASRSDAAVAELLALAADRIHSPDIDRYEPALRGNADYLRALDAAAQERESE
ncbi:tetratricopeptide repeat protein [Agreia bicolorata]|uniref:tetratricopeptide repeat protein n=1 Tax=Agreia bicolorata TaxID=110935 RepID=UPI0005C8F84C